MRHEGWNENKVAGRRVGAKFEPFTPTHAGPSAYDVDHALEFAVMVRTSFCSGLDRDGSRPERARPGAGRTDAAARLIPGLCGVSPSSWSCVTMRTPSRSQFAPLIADTRLTPVPMTHGFAGWSMTRRFAAG